MEHPEIEISEDELKRLAFQKQTDRRVARWENIYRLYHEGWSFDRVAKHYGCHVSTIKRLLRTAARKRIERGVMTWPKDSLGRKICDLPHPMPRGENPAQWCHNRAKPLSRRRTHYFKHGPYGCTRESVKIPEDRREEIGYCSVCRMGGHLGMPVKPKTLCEVFSSNQTAK